MRKRHLGILLASLIAASAQAVPIVTYNGAMGTVSVDPGTSATITIGIIPDPDLVSGYNLIFEITDTANVSLVSCAPQAGVSVSCPVGGANFSFGAALSSDASAPFIVGTFTIDIGAGAPAGYVLGLAAAATITDSLFNDIFVGPQQFVFVNAVPEPGVAALGVLGIAGLALIGRKRATS